MLCVCGQVWRETLVVPTLKKKQHSCLLRHQRNYAREAGGKEFIKMQTKRVLSLLDTRDIKPQGAKLNLLAGELFSQ